MQHSYSHTDGGKKSRVFLFALYLAPFSTCSVTVFVFIAGKSHRIESCFVNGLRFDQEITFCFVKAVFSHFISRNVAKCFGNILSKNARLFRAVDWCTAMAIRNFVRASFMVNCNTYRYDRCDVRAVNAERLNSIQRISLAQSNY